MTPSKSLGNILAHRLALGTRAPPPGPPSEEELKARQEREELLVETFFANAKSLFKHEILAGRPLSRIRVGNGANLEVASLIGALRSEVPITNFKHRMSFYWGDFAMWAKDNGLAPVWEFHNDFSSECAWYELSVKPA